MFKLVIKRENNFVYNSTTRSAGFWRNEKYIYKNLI